MFNWLLLVGTDGHANGGTKSDFNVLIFLLIFILILVIGAVFCYFLNGIFKNSDSNVDDEENNKKSDKEGE